MKIDLVHGDLEKEIYMSHSDIYVVKVKRAFSFEFEDVSMYFKTISYDVKIN